MDKKRNKLDFEDNIDTQRKTSKAKRFAVSAICVLMLGFMILSLILTFIIGYKIIMLLIHGILNVAMIGEFAISLTIFAICYGIMDTVTDVEPKKPKEKYDEHEESCLFTKGEDDNE